VTARANLLVLAPDARLDNLRQFHRSLDAFADAIELGHPDLIETTRRDAWACLDDTVLAFRKNLQALRHGTP
jgi:hypothetical protein